VDGVFRGCGGGVLGVGRGVFRGHGGGFSGVVDPVTVFYLKIAVMWLKFNQTSYLSYKCLCRISLVQVGVSGVVEAVFWGRGVTYILT
jgi:hypothetical protein